MKGLSQMRTYNNFIRKNIDKRNNWKSSKDENTISRYISEDGNENYRNNIIYNFKSFNSEK